MRIWKPKNSLLALGLVGALWSHGLSEPSFLERDLDGNGRLTPVESLLPRQTFQRLDESSNGELSLGEFGPYWVKNSSSPHWADRAYASDSPRQTLDLYLPEDRSPGDKLPLVLWIHGGSWKSGDKENCPISSLTKSGVAVASVNYRYTTESPYPAQLNDCRRAVSWLQAQEDKLGVTFGETTAVGLSAGGHIALQLGAKNSVQQVVAFAAPVDLGDATARSRFRETLELLMGGNLEEREQLLKEASPLHTAEKSTADYLLVHGLEDRLIPYEQSLLLSTKLAHLGRFVQLHLLPDGSHSLVGGPNLWHALRRFVRTP